MNPEYGSRRPCIRHPLCLTKGMAKLFQISLLMCGVLLFGGQLSAARSIIGSIEITGLERTKEITVLRELPFAVGSGWQADFSDRAEQRLRNLGIFSEVAVFAPDEKGAVIIRARLKLDKESKEMVAERIADYLKRRKQSQPLEYPSAGSVFKNPPYAYAGRLIENAGLKGKRIGGAMISDKHGNFIVNTGGARAKDILDLLYLAQAEVKKGTGIELEPEIKIIGD